MKLLEILKAKILDSTEPILKTIIPAMEDKLTKEGTSIEGASDELLKEVADATTLEALFKCGVFDQWDEDEANKWLFKVLDSIEIQHYYIEGDVEYSESVI